MKARFPRPPNRETVFSNVRLAKRGLPHRFNGSILKMNISGLITILALAPPQPPAGTARNPTGDLVYMLGMFAILGIMFYFVLIRPQQKKAKEHSDLVRALRPGDKILTTGGILGVVVSVKEKSVSIRSADAKLEVLKSAVSEIMEKAVSSAET